MKDRFTKSPGHQTILGKPVPATVFLRKGGLSNCFIYLFILSFKEASITVCSFRSYDSFNYFSTDSILVVYVILKYDILV